MKAIAFRRTHRRAGATMELWLSMTIAIAACASPEDTRPPAIGDCDASGDAACTSAPLGAGAAGPSNGGLRGSGGEAGSIATGTSGAGAASEGNDAGVAPVASAASVSPPASD